MTSIRATRPPSDAGCKSNTVGIWGLVKHERVRTRSTPGAAPGRSKVQKQRIAVAILQCRDPFRIPRLAHHAPEARHPPATWSIYPHSRPLLAGDQSFRGEFFIGRQDGVARDLQQSRQQACRRKHTSTDPPGSNALGNLTMDLPVQWYSRTAVQYDLRHGALARQEVVPPSGPFHFATIRRTSMD